MAQPTTPAAAVSASSHPLYPPLESSIAPLDKDERYRTYTKLTKQLASELNQVATEKDLLEDIGDRTILPAELFTDFKKIVKPKVDPLQRIRQLPTEEVEDEEEEAEDEEAEDEEVVENEEEDAGGDYLVSHFDNGENFEDNDDDGDGEDV